MIEFIVSMVSVILLVRYATVEIFVLISMFEFMISMMFVI